MPRSTGREAVRGAAHRWPGRALDRTALDRIWGLRAGSMVSLHSARATGNAWPPRWVPPWRSPAHWHGTGTIFLHIAACSRCGIAVRISSCLQESKRQFIPERLKDFSQIVNEKTLQFLFRRTQQRVLSFEARAKYGRFGGFDLVLPKLAACG